MNWAVIAIQRLRDYENRKQSLANIPMQIKTLEMQCEALRSATTDGTPVRGGTNMREDMLVSNIAKREELKNNYRIAKREVELTEKGLSALTDDERKILELFYINRPRDYIERLCEELCVERSRVYTLKDNALHKFTVVVYGVVEI